MLGCETKTIENPETKQTDIDVDTELYVQDKLTKTWGSLLPLLANLGNEDRGSSGTNRFYKGTKERKRQLVDTSVNDD
ncbi:hypothetical protein RRG08_010634 [Elysia crispata]|uniref:Uncharacterized protein n=1 Tax=Elysia crispata TaxID=231223 RepID=A0AAE0XPN8_9GAST|nr:hypothetical protein RRG08_010634 [Elysia crispata]